MADNSLNLSPLDAPKFSKYGALPGRAESKYEFSEAKAWLSADSEDQSAEGKRPLLLMESEDGVFFVDLYFGAGMSKPIYGGLPPKEEIQKALEKLKSEGAAQISVG